MEKYTIPEDLKPYVEKQAYTGRHTYSIVKCLEDDVLTSLALVIERNCPRKFDTLVYFKTKDDLIKSSVDGQLRFYLPNLCGVRRSFETIKGTRGCKGKVKTIEIPTIDYQLSLFKYNIY